jgi:hypothetical protein
MPGENTIAVRLEAPEDARRTEKIRGLTWDMPRDQLYSIAKLEVFRPARKNLHDG